MNKIEKLSVEQREAIQGLAEIVDEGDAVLKKLKENNEKLCASQKELNYMQKASAKIDEKIAALEQQLSQEIANLASLKAKESNL